MTNYVITEVPGGRAVDHVYPVCFGPIFESGGVYCGENIKFDLGRATRYVELADDRLIAAAPWVDAPARVVVLEFLERIISLQGLTLVDSSEMFIEFTRPVESQADSPGHAYGMVALFHAMRLAGEGAQLAVAIMLYLHTKGVSADEYVESVGGLSMLEVMGIVCMAGKMLRCSFLSEMGMGVTFAPSSSDNGTIFSSEQFSDKERFKRNVKRAITGIPEFWDDENWEGHEDLAEHEVSHRQFFCAMPHDVENYDRASCGAGSSVMCPLTGAHKFQGWMSARAVTDIGPNAYVVSQGAWRCSSEYRCDFVYTWDQVVPLVMAFMSVFIDESKGESK